MTRQTQPRPPLAALLLCAAAGVFAPPPVWADHTEPDPLSEFEDGRTDRAAAAAAVEEETDDLAGKLRAFGRYVGRMSAKGYFYAIAAFLGIPFALFVLKFFYNMTIAPLRQKKRVVAYLQQNAQVAPEDIPARARDAMAKKRYQEAADLFLRMGDQAHAAMAYEKAGELVHAAQFFTRAGRHRDAARLFGAAGRHLEAAEQWEDARLPRNAADAYLRGGDEAAAARCLEQAGDVARAAEIYEREGNLLKAAGLYERSGDAERAHRLKERAAGAPASPPVDDEQVDQLMLTAEGFRSGEAGAVSRRKLLDAIGVYLARGDAAAAADLYARSQIDLAEELLAKVPYHSNVALHYAQMFLKARDYKSAATVFEHVGKYHEAAELYVRGQEYYYAGEMYEMAGLAERAAEMYARGGAPTKAAPLFETLGKKALAAECYERAGQLHNAATLFEEAGVLDRALRLLKAVPHNDPGYLDAQERMHALEARGVSPAAVAAAPAPAPPAPRPGAAPARPAATPSRPSVTGARELVAPLEGIEWFRESTYFKDLALDELRELYGICTGRTYGAGQVIIEDGDAGEALYVVKQGRVGVFKRGQRIAELGPGDHFGEISLLTGAAATARVQSLEPVQLFRIDRDGLERFLATREGAAARMYRAFTAALANRLRKSNDAMVGEASS
jgi:tetratricopeptide (TPR) repeat protein